MLAWELGCKGLTVYVTGSRQQVVLETKATQGKKSDETAPDAAQTAPSAQPDAAQVNGKTSGHGSGRGSAQSTSNGDIKPRPEISRTKRPRPSTLKGITYRKDTPLGTAYITVNTST